MVTSVLSTNSYKLNQAINFKEKISSTDEFFYVYTSDFSPHANSQLQPLYDNTRIVYSDVYSNMIFGKRVTANTVSLAIQYVPWTSNTTYESYDDISSTIATDPFYTITDEGSFFHVWKCLENNNDSVSTIQPQFSFVSGANTVSFQTSDGYVWKYMTSIDSTTVSKFKVGNDYFPIAANTAVSLLAEAGAINSFKIENQGKFYNNYISGTLRTGDIFINGSKTFFNISNNQVMTTNSYYVGCMFLMTSGTAKGQYRTIKNFVANSVGNIIELDTQMAYEPSNGDTFEITPQVSVKGDGGQTINCAARALVNAINSNSVYRIEIIEPGADYKYASANVVINPLVGINIPAVIRPIMPPPGGHGASVANELYCHNLVISTSFANTEGNTIPAVNRFNTFGLLHNPRWANVGLVFSTIRGSFVQGETVLQLSPSRMNGNVVVQVGNTTLRSDTAEWTTQTYTGQYIYTTTPDFALSQIYQVNAVSNATHITVNHASSFACSQALVYSANVISQATISAIPGTPNTIYVSDSTPALYQGALIMGLTSGAQGIINSFNISGDNKGYNTFIGLYKYIATTVNGTFVQGETVKQGNNIATLHSISGSGTLTLLASGTPLTANGGVIVGQSSAAIGNITNVYVPEVIFNSADIEYIENISPVTRQPNQSETIQLVLNF